MRLSYFTVVTLLLALHVLIPIILIVWTWKKQNRSMMGWMMQIFAFSSYFVFIFLMGTWALVSFYLRYAFPALFVIAGIVSYWRAKGLLLSTVRGKMGWIGNGASLGISAVLIYLIIGGLRSHAYDEKPVNLAFPFKKGVYAVFEGGNGKASSLMNYHYEQATHKEAGVNRSMQYAVDITKLSVWGNDAHGFLPRENEKYAISTKWCTVPVMDGFMMLLINGPTKSQGGIKLLIMQEIILLFNVEIF